jgi:hypothetical protein
MCILATTSVVQRGEISKEQNGIENVVAGRTEEKIVVEGTLENVPAHASHDRRMMKDDVFHCVFCVIFDFSTRFCFHPYKIVP